MSIIKEEKKETVSDFTIEHAKKRPISFHMPGHKGRFRTFDNLGYRDFALSLINQDITEIRGADVLSKPSEVILNVMKNYKELYGVKDTELLINGSSVGIIASILAHVPRGGSIIIDRLSHKSVYSAIRLGGIKPVYTDGSVDSIRDALIKAPEASTVLITTPDYMGNISNIRRIANAVHTLDKILIVDQAHGAHLKFFDEAFGTRMSAENQGADIVIESTHKTLFSFTGTGILNICSDKVKTDEIRENLAMLETTSPSYILMDSLDINEKIMREHGEKIVKDWRNNIINFYKKASNIEGLNLPYKEMILGKNYQSDIDITKIRIDMSGYGLSGVELETRLIQHRIFAEMAYENEVLLYTGAGNTKEDFDELIKALKYIADSEIRVNKNDRFGDKMIYQKSGELGKTRAYESGKKVHSPYITRLEQEEIPSEYEYVSIRYAEGRVLYEPIIPFPPGRPIACPGEVVSRELINEIMKLMMAEKKILGINDDAEIKVGKLHHCEDKVKICDFLG